MRFSVGLLDPKQEASRTHRSGARSAWDYGSEGESDTVVERRSEIRMTSGADAEDRAFFSMLQSAGLLRELSPVHLAGAGQPGEDRHARRARILRAYYRGSGDDVCSRRRCADDMCLPYGVEDLHSAGSLVDALRALVPEVGGVQMAFAAPGEQPHIVLSDGQRSVPVTDDEALADEVTAPVAGLVRSFNQLLSHASVKPRFVLLACDERTEIYAGLCLADAVELVRAGHGPVDDVEWLLDHAGW